jgi:hypothetical protein
MRHGFLAGGLLLLASGSASAQPMPGQWPYPAYPVAPRYTPVPYYPAYPPGPYRMVPAYPPPPTMARPGALPDPQLLPAQGRTPSAPVTPAQAATTAQPPPSTDAPSAAPLVESESFPVDFPGTDFDAPGTPLFPSPTATPYLRPHHDKFWVAGGYLTSFIRPGNFNIPLVTTGSSKDTPPGALGQPGTAVLFGNGPVDYGTFHGGWMQVGFFLDPANRWSIDLGGFLLAQNQVSYAISSDPTGNPIVTRPIFNVNSQREAAFVDALTGVASGGTLINANSLLLGGEINGRYHLYCWKRLHTDFLLGYRTLHFEEGLTIDDRVVPIAANNFTFLGNVVNPPNTIADQDRFKAMNSFNGANFGGRLQWEEDWCSVDVFGKVAVGVNSQIANIMGSSTLNTPGGGGSTAAGGLLALPSNIGNHSRHTFGVVREVGVNLNFDPLQHVRFRVGYSFLLWNGVVRTGDMLDRVINPGQVPTDQGFGTPGPNRPAFVFKDELLWAHFLNLGMEVHY